jgi:hypothetical protein
MEVVRLTSFTSPNLEVSEPWASKPWPSKPYAGLEGSIVNRFVASLPRNFVSHTFCLLDILSLQKASTNELST